MQDLSQQTPRYHLRIYTLTYFARERLKQDVSKVKKV